MLKPGLREKLDSVIRTIDGSQPIDVAGAISALQALQTADQIFVCKHCGTDTMVENWIGSGIDQLHCFTCKR
jgi:transposase